MKWGQTEIGGAEPGAVTIRFNGDVELPQNYVYKGRVLLGELKRQMQLAGIKSGQINHREPDGTKIHAHSNAWGLAPIDEIWIDLTNVFNEEAPVTSTLSVVSFHAYCSTFLSGKQADYETGFVEATNLFWYMYEPIHTSGGYIMAFTYEQAPSPLGNLDYHQPRYRYAAPSFVTVHDDPDYLASDVDPNIVWPSPDLRDNMPLIAYGYNGNQNINDGAQTAHGLYCIPEYCFAHIFKDDGINRFKDSTIIRYSCHPQTEFKEQIIPSQAFYYDMQWKAVETNFSTGYEASLDNLELSYVAQYLVPKRAHGFLDGWYALTASMESNPLIWNPSDNLQVTFVVERDDGSKVSQHFNIPVNISQVLGEGKTPVNSVIMINPNLGKLRHYVLPDIYKNTFAGRINYALPDPNISGYMGIDFAEVYKNFIVLEVDLLA